MRRTFPERRGALAVDLVEALVAGLRGAVPRPCRRRMIEPLLREQLFELLAAGARERDQLGLVAEIGRASCRERV